MGPSIDASESVTMGGWSASNEGLAHIVNSHDIHRPQQVTAHSEEHSCWKETLLIIQTLLLTKKAHRMKLEHRLDFMLHRRGNLMRTTRERDEVHEETRRIFLTKEVVTGSLQHGMQLDRIAT